MRPHRLQRLKLLTQGAALLGLGSVEACQQTQPPEPIHINSPYMVEDSGAAVADAGAATPPPAPPEAPHMNAPYTPPDAGANKTGTAGAAAIATSEPSAKPPKLIINAPPKHINAPNKVSE